jgi:hypothetical protein
VPKSVLTRGRSFVARLTALAMVASIMVIGAVPASAAIDTSATCPSSTPSAGFTDIGGLPAATQLAINCLVDYGISQGTSATTFSPDMEVSRWQMALFLTRQAEVHGLTLGDGSDQGFTDISAYPVTTQVAINQLAQLGITTGTTATTFSPEMAVSRWQMALFLTRLLDAAGYDLGDGSDQGFADIGDYPAATQLAINQLAQAEVSEGFNATTFGPASATLRWQMALFLTRTLAAGGIVAETGQNQNLTAAPELLAVNRIGDIVVFKFDQPVPGKSLDFFNTLGVLGDLGVGDEVSYYTGFRIYDVAGTARYATEAGIFGDEVRARFGSATIVAAAARAGVYEGAVENAQGRANPASDFPLQATLAAPAAIPPYFPQLTFVGNLRTTVVTPAEILVDYRFTFATEASATANLAAIGAWLPGNEATLADDFALVGAAGQVFRGLDIEGAVRSGANITVTVVMDPAIEDVPVSQLERGFVEEDAFSAAGLDHILLSHNYETTSVVNGVTTDPDLRAVERGPGANQMRFVFDEGVSVPTGILDRPDLYQVATAGDERLSPDSIGRSLVAADGATVMIAIFNEGSQPVGYATITEYLDEVVAATVNVDWQDADRLVVGAAAARGTDQVGSQQLGWSTPAQVLVTPVQPPVPADPVPGVTALPDLVSVTKTQNAITGNWKVTFVFDQTATPAGVPVIDFSLYDTAGVRFSSTSRDVVWADGAAVAGQQVFTFGPDVEGLLSPTFSNEQIAAAVLATVQDADADLGNVGTFGAQEPRITEGHDGV